MAPLIYYYINGAIRISDNEFPSMKFEYQSVA